MTCKTRELGRQKTGLPDAEVDDPLFEDSIHYFEQSGFAITRISRDLHQETDLENFVTEHEAHFSSLGIPIKLLIAKKLSDFSATSE